MHLSRFVLEMGNDYLVFTVHLNYITVHRRVYKMFLLLYYLNDKNVECFFSFQIKCVYYFNMLLHVWLLCVCGFPHILMSRNWCSWNCCSSQVSIRAQLFTDMKPNRKKCMYIFSCAAVWKNTILWKALNRFWQ